MTDEIEVRLEGMSVGVGLPIRGHFPPKTTMSLCASVHAMAVHGVRHGLLMNVCGIVQMARSNVLTEFLKSDFQKLFWIDSDMVWSANDFMKLVAMSTQVDVIAVSYPAKVEGPATYYANFDADRRVGPFGLQEIKGTGLGFTIMDRKVCQALADRAPLIRDRVAGRDFKNVFRVDTVGDGDSLDFRGEDIAFFADIRELGYTVWCDPTIELGHIGEREWRGRLMDAFSAT